MRWVNAEEQANLSKLRGASLLVVCAGKNLCRTTPSLIGSEVNTSCRPSSASCRTPARPRSQYF